MEVRRIGGNWEIEDWGSVMGEENLIQLYPLPSREVPLEGLYLSHDIRGAAAEVDHAFVYTNYVVSLDGRIAIPRADGPGMMVPKAIANERDWRLFQELAIQADVIITSGRYLRDYAGGQVQEILTVYDDPAFADLKQWRLDRGLPPQPDLAVISGSLDFPIPHALRESGRRVLVFTTAIADRARVAALKSQGGEVYAVGERHVDGALLVEQLTALGHRTVYNSTGPKVFHLLLAGGALDRLYLTHANRLLGGQPYATVVEGDLLTPPVDMTLHSAYYDPHALGGAGQMFVAYQRLKVEG